MEEPKSLHYYLEDLSRLEEISLGALEQWSKRLPYVQNIRLLIAKKNQQLGQVQNLDPFHVAATYSIDRTRLYEVLREKATVNKKIQLASLHDASILENTGLLEEMVQNTNHQSVEEPEIGINSASENVNIDIDEEDTIIQKPDDPAPEEYLSTQEVIEEDKAEIEVETTAMDIISPVIEENIKELEDINTEDPISADSALSSFC